MKNSKMDNIIDKIKKLLRLSTSNNENEAALALQRAKELMDKYNLSEVSLNDQFIEDNFNENNVFEIGLKFTAYNKRLPVYKDIIAANIANIFSCKSIRNYPIIIDNEIKYCIGLIGFEADVIIAEYAIEYTINFIDKKVKELYALYKKLNKKKPKRFKLSYTIGVLNTIEQKIQQLASYKNNNDLYDSTTDIDSENLEKMLTIKTNAIDIYLNTKYNITSKGNPEHIKYNPIVAQQGSNDAKDYNINVAMAHDDNSKTQIHMLKG